MAHILLRIPEPLVARRLGLRETAQRTPETQRWRSEWSSNFWYSLVGRIGSESGPPKPATETNADQLPAIGPEPTVSGPDTSVPLSQDPAKRREFPSWLAPRVNGTRRRRLVSIGPIRVTPRPSRDGRGDPRTPALAGGGPSRESSPIRAGVGARANSACARSPPWRCTVAWPSAARAGVRTRHRFALRGAASPRGRVPGVALWSRRGKPGTVPRRRPAPGSGSEVVRQLKS